MDPDPDPGGSKTYGSGFGSEFATLLFSVKKYPLYPRAGTSRDRGGEGGGGEQQRVGGQLGR
jgi:hypothetical protein